MGGLTDFYPPPKKNQGEWELIDSLEFHFMVGPNFGEYPWLEPAFLLAFLFDFQENYSELAHT